jgi:hypothetical protein
MSVICSIGFGDRKWMEEGFILAVKHDRASKTTDCIWCHIWSGSKLFGILLTGS